MRTLLMLLAAVPGLAHAEYTCPDYASEPAKLRNLEQHATKGALSDDEKACLEDNFARADVQTTKDKISRVLMVNGYAYDTGYWAELVARHLEEVDRSDPDIAYLYAYYLYNSDDEGGRIEEVVQWTDVALERKDVWKGDVFVSRVYGLLRLRAFAAYDIWSIAEAGLVKGEGTAEEVEVLRNEAKTYSREWVDMAKSAGRDAQDAFDLCISVANAQACGAE